MKRLLFVCLMLLSTLGIAQGITGDWNALLKVSGQELPLIFHVTATETGYESTLDSPKQGALGLKANATTFENNTLTVSLAQLGITYTGTLGDDGNITGTFNQGGVELPLDLTKDEIGATPSNRPQEPKAPFPYEVEEVSYANKEAGITMAGTLTLPKSAKKNTTKYPAVILISGSGAQNRDEELLGHKPFLVLADHLTRNGFAVLRYDDRGTAQSTGDHSTATSADFATDAQAAFDYLLTRSDIDLDKIGFAGHSEGGFIAPMVAAKNKQVAFIALLAGVGQTGYAILTDQSYLIGKAQGVPEATLVKNRKISNTIFNLVKKYGANDEKSRYQIESYLETALKENPEIVPAGITAEQFSKQQLNTLLSPWFKYFIVTDPAQFLKQVSCPVLAINGSLDLQVPAKANLSAIEVYVKKGGNKDVTIIELANLNHLFQHTKTGNPAEYGTIEETFAPEALKVISDWLKEKTQ